MRIGACKLCREEHEYMLKFLLVGDADVGKDEIADVLGPSVSYTPDALFIPFAVPRTTTILLEGKLVRLQLWNASGQGRFSTIIKSYSRGVQGILLVYDITNRWSFDGIRRWLAEIDEHAPGVPRILIGNRLHLEFNRAVPRHEAEYFARKRNMQYFEFHGISTSGHFEKWNAMVVEEFASCLLARSLLSSYRKEYFKCTCYRPTTSSHISPIKGDCYLIVAVYSVRSFASGADLCMRSVIRRQYATPYFSSASKYITHFVRARNTSTKDHLRNSNCDLM